ncbi:hypothetical protein M8J77_022643 [Diaphorina citri]|nr:hypothetical protein M8J77_022643 [Diaphorina citri]
MNEFYISFSERQVTTATGKTINNSSQSSITVNHSSNTYHVLRTTIIQLEQRNTKTQHTISILYGSQVAGVAIIRVNKSSTHTIQNSVYVLLSDLNKDPTEVLVEPKLRREELIIESCKEYAETDKDESAIENVDKVPTDNVEILIKIKDAVLLKNLQSCN